MKEEVIIRIRELRQKGYSYREIVRICKKSLRDVQKYSQNVNFNWEGQIRYSNLNGVRKKIKPQKKLTPIKARLIAHLLFDGTVISTGFNRIIRYINSSPELIEQFILDVEEIYGLKNPTIEENPERTYMRVSFGSVLAFRDLMTYFNSYSTSKKNIKIPKKIMESKGAIKKEFLKAFFEDEGSITANGRLFGDLKNKNIIYQLKDLLEEFDLKSKICTYSEPTGMMYKLYLPKRKENLENFASLELFEKSRVSKGKNKGKFKQDVLFEAIKSFKKLK
ncbi:hypothetical protein CMI41_01410 [Candidatus Pacearchaeota archaeon]|nr:hypothetical protein [Candidatus Pacearchaeota archaeon]|tara:strand:+ start:5155 stop:5988 length:834 start_codon:yes stop_codon:yes gene_type:complete